MVQRLAFAPTGRSADQRVESMTAHVMTPATKDTTRYFVCHTSELASGDPTMALHVRAVLTGALAGQDSPVLAAQQERIGPADFLSLRPVVLPIDAGAVAVRRRIDALRNAEQTQ